MIDYTLQLFGHLLQKPAPLFDEVAFEQVRAQFEEFSQTAHKDREVENAMIAFGAQAGPYWEAYEWMYEHHTGSRKKDFLLQQLGSELAQKFTAFEAQGGNMHDYRHGELFEQAFTSEENVKIQDAFLIVDEELSRYVETIIHEDPDAQAHYIQLVKQIQDEYQQIQMKLDELEKIKDSGDLWDTEIDEELYFFKKGFARLEKRPTVAIVQEKIDWYKGQIETGNK